MKYWLVRSPFRTRKWEDVLMAEKFKLYGIRSYASKKNIAQMKKGDIVLWYSSPAGRKIFGIMKVMNPCYPDNTGEGNWLAIDFVPILTFKNPIYYNELKKNIEFQKSNIFRQKRITVVEISQEEYKKIVKLGQSE